ncbi:hypothetical protein [Antribacter gilvus]|uniref:hypothetical protein n=1 Tax=Antribacter gilvus TaxID=2304675 RepID=UPI000F76E1D8|nr:hypothetical protein [Antribacter gilvus]
MNPLSRLLAAVDDWLYAVGRAVGATNPTPAEDFAADEPVPFVPVDHTEPTPLYDRTKDRAYIEAEFADKVERDLAEWTRQSQDGGLS